MAQKRMLNKCISISETVNNLSYIEMLIYTWCIPHADDVGLLPASPRKFKSLVVPMWNMSDKKFGFHLETIVKAGLLKAFETGGDSFYYVVGHKKEQTLKRDRNPSSIASGITQWNTVDSIWKTLEEEDKEVKVSKGTENSVGECEGKVSTEDGGVGKSLLKYKLKTLGLKA